MLHVAALYVYPLKGAAGVPVAEAVLTPRGLAGDRRWMLARPDGRFVSGRTHPRLTLVGATRAGGGLRLTAPGLDPFDAPAPGPDAPVLPSSVWEATGLPLREVPAARPWLRAALGDDLRLVHQADDAHRPTDPAYAPGHEVSLAEAYPLLVTTEASRADLERRAGVPLDVRRFRPNVVVGGAGAWAEDAWGALAVGDARLACVKPCARCAVTTLDPDTAEAGPEPLRTLAAFRKVGSKVLFGVNAVGLTPGARLRVGDAVALV